jgi:hypothetical protein
MAITSQQLLEKYRAEEKAAQGTPANPEQTNAESTGTVTESQPTGGEVVNANGDANQGQQEPPSSEKGAQPANGAGRDDDRWQKTQESFKKRLDRQERSHRKTVDALNAEIAELKKQLNSNKADLKREDFPSVEAYENYRKEELKKEILADSRKTQEAQAEAQRRQEAARKRVESTFRTPEARQEFNETLSDFLEDNGDWLESEEGMLYQEIIDQSPVGLVMAMAIAKNAQVTEQMRHWSKDLLYQKLSQFESTLMQQAKAQQAAPSQTKETTPPTEKKPTTSGIPSTGKVGNNAAPSSFNAKEWLRTNRPERYSH